MDNNDDAAHFLLDQFIENFVNDNQAAFDTTINDHPAQYDEVRARSFQIEHVPPIVEGEQFTYRNQLNLSGLYRFQRRGICHNHYVATCIVARYPRHNPVHPAHQDGWLTLGGEGGFIREANRINLRVLDNQQLTLGNRCMRNALHNQSRL
ncbi:hypothetical protein TSUD_363430 [Trifolium subterraneum]|uniref:Uncharacterized protein n=1 Tax=Trifolium subterraneum TaxID=3900 RepID=A0A2Z6N8L6_TRISU|nr:hypothetical protein TSUD_363430 [Trifolium subterraneum]